MNSWNILRKPQDESFLQDFIDRNITLFWSWYKYEHQSMGDSGEFCPTLIAMDSCTLLARKQVMSSHQVSGHPFNFIPTSTFASTTLRSGIQDDTWITEAWVEAVAGTPVLLNEIQAQRASKPWDTPNSWTVSCIDSIRGSNRDRYKKELTPTPTLSHTNTPTDWLTCMNKKYSGVSEFTCFHLGKVPFSRTNC